TQPVSEIVVELFLRDRRLRYSETAEGPGWHQVSVHRPSESAIVRYAVRSRGVDGHARGHSRPPGRVSTGVEIGGEVHRCQLAVAIRTHAKPDMRRVTLGGRDDRFGAGVNHAYRLAQMPGGQRNKGLNREVKLGAKAATDGGRNDAHGFRSDPQNLRDISAVHVRGLGASLNLDLVVDPPGKAGLGFDVGVFDKAGLVLVFHYYVSLRQSAFHVAAHHAASDQHIVLAAGMDALGVRCERGGDCSQPRQLLPRDRKIRVVQSLNGLGLTYDCGDGFTSKPGFNFGEHRLVGETRNHAVTILSGDILRGQNPEDSWVRGNESVEVAKTEARPVVRTADGADYQRADGNFVRSENLRAINLILA